MTGSDSYNEERMLQLLADRATEGIGGVDAAALDGWLAINTDVDAEAFDRAAAAIALTRPSVDDEPLPMSLRGKLTVDAGVFFGWSHER